MRTSSRNLAGLSTEPDGSRRSTRGKVLWILQLVAWLALSHGPPSAAAADPAPAAMLFRVGTSGDYPPFSDREGSGFEGFDIAIARAYADERERSLGFVTFRWPTLLQDLEAGRFDVAMSGITIRADRTVAGRFTVPVVESGAVLLVDRSSRFRRAAEANVAGFRIGVNAGGHLEQVATEHFPSATLLVIPDNRAVLQALASYSVDAVVTDTLEAPRWLAEVSGFKPLGPFTRDRKAYLVRADQPGLARDLDRWLMDRERDGTLAKLRERYLGIRPNTVLPLATPLRALLAAMDERLSIMPLVGSFKRRNGLPLEVPAREETVLDAAVESVRRAAAERQTEGPRDSAVRAFFQAQMEAAKQVQWLSVRSGDIDASEPVPDLDAALRPAILRLGDRIAHLILDLPRDLDATAVSREARSELRTERLTDESRNAIAKALVDLSAAEDAEPEILEGEPGPDVLHRE